MENRKIQDENYILWNGHSYIKPLYSQKTQESVHNGNTKCTIGAQNSNNSTNIQACTTSNIQNMQLVETHIHAETEDTLPSSEEDIEGQMQTPTKRRKYRQRQRTQKRTEQMCQYRARKQPEQMILHNHAQRLPVARQNMEVFNETTVNGHDVGNMDNICSACGALMFKDENHVGKLSQSATITFSACCGNGNIKLPPLKNPPDLLKNLLTGNTHRHKHFHDNIRAYNSSLACASLYLTGQEFSS